MNYNNNKRLIKLHALVVFKIGQWRQKLTFVFNNC